MGFPRPETSAFWTVVYPTGDTTGKSDLTSIQGALNDANTNGGGTVYVDRRSNSGTYYINASLVIYSNTTLRVDPSVTITLVTGSMSNMIHNAAWVAGSGRDSHIQVIGGNWLVATGNDAPAGQQRFLLLFQRVDEGYVADNTWTRADATDVGRDIVFYACTNTVAERNTHNTGGVGILVEGLSSGITIREQYGSTGDDFVAIQASDPSQYLNGNLGDLNGLTIEDIFPTSCQNGVKVFSGIASSVALNIRNVKVRNVVGAALATGALVIFGGDGTVGTATDGLFNGNIYDLSVDGVWPSSTHAGNIVKIQDTGTGTLFGIELSHIPFNDLVAGKFTIGFVAANKAVNVENVLIRDCYWTGTTNTSVSPVRVDSAAGGATTIADLNLRGIDCTVTSLHVIGCTGTSPSVTNCRVKDSRLNMKNTTGSWFDNHNATTPVLTNLWVEDTEIARANFMIGDLVSTTNVWARNLKAGTITALIKVETGATITLVAADGLTGTHACLISSTGTVHGLITSIGTGAPTIAGQVGDIFWRSDGTHGAVTVMYQCTVAGSDGAATWTGII